MIDVTMSVLPKTWLIDLDGTVFRHNGHLSGKDDVLPGSLAFLQGIPPSDVIVLMTARPAVYREATVETINELGVKFDHILFDLPVGERVCINDRKPGGLATAVAINVDRDEGLASIRMTLDPTI